MKLFGLVALSVALILVSVACTVRTRRQSLSDREERRRLAYELVERLARSPSDFDAFRREVQSLQASAPYWAIARPILEMRAKQTRPLKGEDVEGLQASRRRARMALVEWERSHPDTAESRKPGLGIWKALENEVTGDEFVTSVPEFRFVCAAVKNGTDPAANLDGLVCRLWCDVRESLLPEGRLRAALALAVLDAKGPGWNQVAKDPTIIGAMLRLDPSTMAAWGDGLKTVRNWFVPALREAYRGGPASGPLSQADILRMTRAAQLLAVLVPDDAPLLVDLLEEARINPQVEVMTARLKVLAGPPLWKAKELLATASRSPKWPDDLDPPHVMAHADSQHVYPSFLGLDTDLASRARANSAAALIALGRDSPDLTGFRHGPDPLARSYLIHLMGPIGIHPEELVGWFDRETDVSARRAILLALGEDGGNFLDPVERDRIVKVMVQSFTDDPDPGLHAAAGWALGRWGKSTPPISRTPERGSSGPIPGNGRRWYIGANDHAMVVLPPPSSSGIVLMGSPSLHPDYNAKNEELKVQVISRRFAIAAHETTAAQFDAFLPGFSQSEVANETFSPLEQGTKVQPRQPVSGFISWIHAAAYCNWLSCQAEIDRANWCYPNPAKDLNALRELLLSTGGSGDFASRVAKLFENVEPDTTDVTRRLGYRLPTEIEWEYACRAGAVTSRFYGQDDKARLLPYYANFRVTAPLGRTLAVGTLKPNDFGLFDTLGNVAEWCHESYSVDTPGLFKTSKPLYLKKERVIRGGSYEDRAVVVRSAYRIPYPGEDSIFRAGADFGFRVARTLPE